MQYNTIRVAEITAHYW